MLKLKNLLKILFKILEIGKLKKILGENCEREEIPKNMEQALYFRLHDKGSLKVRRWKE